MVKYNASKPFSLGQDDSDHWQYKLSNSGYEFLKKNDLWAVTLKRVDDEALGPYPVKYYQYCDENNEFQRSERCKKYWASCYAHPKNGRLVRVFFDRLSFQRSEIPKEIYTGGCTCPEWNCALFFGFTSLTKNLKNLYFVVHPKGRHVFQKRFRAAFKEVKDEWQISYVQGIVRQLQDKDEKPGLVQNAKDYVNDQLPEAAEFVKTKVVDKIKEEIGDKASEAFAKLVTISADHVLPIADIASFGQAKLIAYALDPIATNTFAHQLRMIGNGMDDSDYCAWVKKKVAMNKKRREERDSKKETDVDVDVDETEVHGNGPLTLEIKDAKALLAKANKGGEIKVEAKVSDGGQLILKTGNGGAPAKVVGFLQKNFKKRELNGKVEVQVLKKSKTTLVG